ncbi:MAG: BamA/TamA family outer membrane protein [Bacteroidales bacterium]|nr:BamA/TamA family outer membrane protein [Bacteroidales bacterium]
MSHVPYRYGSIVSVTDTLLENNEAVYKQRTYLDLVRQFETKASLFAAYPVSAVKRFEAGISAGHYSFRVERFNDYFKNVGSGLKKDKEVLNAPSGYALSEADLAYVFDNSYFGVTSPMQGSRYRLQYSRRFGTLDYNTWLTDYRKYFFMRPFCVAFRGFAQIREGTNAESERINPLFAGYPWYIRGYNDLSFQTKNAQSDNDIQIDQLLGSKLIISNVELRIPFTGPKRLSLVASRFLFIDFAVFFDAGLAWKSSSKVAFNWQPVGNKRIPVYSTGASLRINMFGLLVLEPYCAIPLQRQNLVNQLSLKGVFGLNFWPGW